jgi:hypothetical protein
LTAGHVQPGLRPFSNNSDRLVGNLHNISYFQPVKKFKSVPEAFEWWLKNIYPGLPAERKKGRLTNAWRDYTHKRGISESRMKEILMEFGEIQVKTEVAYQPH